MSNTPLTNVRVDLTDVDGNAFAVLGTVMKALKREGYSSDFVQIFRKEATAGDYDDLLQTVIKYVEVI